MRLNCSLPQLTVDPESYEVKIGNELVDVEPAVTLPLSGVYNLF